MEIPKKQIQTKFFNNSKVEIEKDTLIECLGMTFENDDKRRVFFL